MTLCRIWGESTATWVDADTEDTKDVIDYSIRKYEATCAPYGGPP